MKIVEYYSFHYLMEEMTVVQYGIPYILVVLNNTYTALSIDKINEYEPILDGT
ncbi:MAG: hypothetical protein ACR2M1_05960, partial [Gemmatimonadaceae bacterium]